MLTRKPKAVAGFSLIEMLITLVVLGILFMIGLPSMATWMQNTQVRNSAEGLISGLQLARNEALRRNRTVQFTLVETLDASCAPATSGTSWIVSVTDPSSLCDQAPSEAGAQIVQKRGQEGSVNALIAASTPTVGFNGIGRLTTAAAQIDVTSQTANCQTGSPVGPIRCLRVNVSTSGSIRMCDPAVTDAADPRAC